MMITFVSECEKKALLRTRRVLDAFANRIGERTWQTIITEEGLLTVKKLLKKTATKNTAISCHWLRSRSRSELVWIVGNRSRFNDEGYVPVNWTGKNIIKKEWENNWHYLPAIKALVAVSSLLHDWGKATALFQGKLTPKKSKGKNSSDPLRHEWISCLLLIALVNKAGGDDKSWLELISVGIFNDNFKEEQLEKIVQTKGDFNETLSNLPPIAQLVVWLILTHHRLPFLFNEKDRKEYSYQKSETIAQLFESLSSAWGYKNSANQEKLAEECFKFPKGLLGNSQPWVKALKKWSKRLLECQAQITQLIENGAYRLLLHHSRLCLMLGDHYYSSQNADKSTDWKIDLFANTDKKTGKTKQKLDEHMVKVSEHALKISQSLSRFSSEMEKVYDVKSFKQRAEKGFEWQDKAVEKIKNFREQNSENNDCGYFVVNIASTGCGKTIANAKLMKALSDDGESLRYVLALGLRTLTLQTGDEYREKIGLNNDELAVLIGSAATKELHEKSKIQAYEKDENFEEIGSESLEDLLDEDLDCQDSPSPDFLDAVIPKHDSSKLKAFLYKPVLACTIDHIIAATETVRGGKYILPCLRLLSSDLVIDEVDDFDGKDLVAIGRLIHFAAMLGRKVMISSATIPPDLAEGFFNCYQEGWKIHANFKQANPDIACIWVDEFNSKIELIKKGEQRAIACQEYQNFHQNFIIKRLENLEKQAVRRKGFIVKIDELLATKDGKEEKYFGKIKQTIIDLHRQHHTIDSKTKKLVSFGVVRIANIPPCIELTQYLLRSNWESGFSPKIMAYHSCQVLLLRHAQEEHLNKVLKRKEKAGEVAQAFKDSIIRSHIDSNDDQNQNVIFILVATPVEEVGRDHDFDWAVVEPSSYRSIIQLSGRVCRHRQVMISQPNVALMQYNLRALRQDEKPVFCRPGYETRFLKLNFSDLCQLTDEEILKKSINAAPRIQKPTKLNPKESLSDLEHQAMHNVLTSYDKTGPKYLQSWLTESWWLTALPQQLNRFRESAPEIKLYLVYEEGEMSFCEKSQSGEFVDREDILEIEKLPPISKNFLQRLWLNRNYKKLLEKEVERDGVFLENENFEDHLRKKSEKYGEIMIRKGEEGFFYSDQFGLWNKKI